MIPIRILHVIESIDGVGGMEMGTIKLIQHLDQKCFEHVLCVVREMSYWVDHTPTERARIVCLGRTNPGFSTHIGALARVIAEVCPDIVHSRNWGAIEAVLAGRWLRCCRLVHSEHGIDSSNVGPEPWRRRCLRRLAYELADRVFSVSYGLRDLYAQSTGFPARKIGVIHNGVDTHRFCPQPAARAQTRQRLGIRAEEFCIGAIGRLEPVKDLLTLLRAAAELHDSRCNMRLLIAGTGTELPALQQFASSHPNLQARVDFLGLVPYVPELLNGLDVYVLPSVSEGISNSLLEAMATGLPVIVSATGGNPEVVVNGESGLLFPIGDSRALSGWLRTLFEQGPLRVRLGQQAMQRVQETFSLGSMVREYEKLYRGLAA